MRLSDCLLEATASVAELPLFRMVLRRKVTLSQQGRYLSPVKLSVYRNPYFRRGCFQQLNDFHNTMA